MFYHVTLYVNFHPTLEIAAIIRQVVITITLTPVQRKRRHRPVHFLSSASNDPPPDLVFPSP